jgi:hypothetical protein
MSSHNTIQKECFNFQETIFNIKGPKQESMQRDKTKELFLKFSDLDWGHIYRNRRNLFQNWGKNYSNTLNLAQVFSKGASRRCNLMISNYCQWTGNIIAWSFALSRNKV